MIRVDPGLERFANVEQRAIERAELTKDRRVAVPELILGYSRTGQSLVRHKLVELRHDIELARLYTSDHAVPFRHIARLANSNLILRRPRSFARPSRRMDTRTGSFHPSRRIA